MDGDCGESRVVRRAGEIGEGLCRVVRCGAGAIEAGAVPGVLGTVIARLASIGWRDVVVGGRAIGAAWESGRVGLGAGWGWDMRKMRLAARRAVSHQWRSGEEVFVSAGAG
jgi:hypothetical protein